MSVPAAARRTLAPLAIVTAAALLFTLLLLLVRLQWAPLESADHDAATRLNSLIARHSVVVTIVKAVTWLGSTGALSPRPTPTFSRPNRRQPCVVMTALARTAVSPPGWW